MDQTVSDSKEMIGYFCWVVALSKISAVLNLRFLYNAILAYVVLISIVLNYVREGGRCLLCCG